MAKNFLYLESLIRNNCEKDHKCGLCQSSLKYLQYVNKNIMQVLGNFDSIVHAARVFSSQVPPSPKYAVKKPEPKNYKSVRSEGGAMLTSQKSISKTLRPIKSQKSKKSLKETKTIKSSKSGKSLSKSKKKAINATKKGISHGKKVLISKFKLKPSKSPKLKKQLSNVVRSASQYHAMRATRSKLASKSKLLKKPPPTSINWRLLKRNLPQRGITIGVQ
ncbi:GH23815 [Drosophila grimshawi]|uniref:GH23815 n=2 Tax=Drosophila grimshawi TaxID=7222 RepID=B4JTE7_DROGR|nr:GH23815 [Drosophila grimshawi]